MAQTIPSSLPRDMPTKTREETSSKEAASRSVVIRAGDFDCKGNPSWVRTVGHEFEKPEAELSICCVHRQ